VTTSIAEFRTPDGSGDGVVVPVVPERMIEPVVAVAIAVGVGAFLYE
jgi:hypothetical protein